MRPVELREFDFVGWDDGVRTGCYIDPGPLRAIRTPIGPGARLARKGIAQSV